MNENFQEKPQKKIKIQIGEDEENNLEEINQQNHEIYQPENENSEYSDKESSEYKIKKKLSNF